MSSRHAGDIARDLAIFIAGRTGGNLLEQPIMFSPPRLPVP
jgi:hypothetical protein